MGGGPERATFGQVLARVLSLKRDGDHWIGGGAVGRVGGGSRAHFDIAHGRVACFHHGDGREGRGAAGEGWGVSGPRGIGDTCWQIFGAGESFILETENGRKGEEGKRGEEKGREEGEEKKRKGRRSEPCDPGTSGFSLE